MEFDDGSRLALAGLFFLLLFAGLYCLNSVIQPAPANRTLVYEDEHSLIDQQSGLMAKRATYFDGKTESTDILVYNPSDEEAYAKLLIFIDKSVASRASDLSISGSKYEVVQEDPVVVFELNVKSASISTINYRVSRSSASSASNFSSGFFAVWVPDSWGKSELTSFSEVLLDNKKLFSLSQKEKQSVSQAISSSLKSNPSQAADSLKAMVSESISKEAGAAKQADEAKKELDSVVQGIGSLSATASESNPIASTKSFALSEEFDLKLSGEYGSIKQDETGLFFVSVDLSKAIAKDTCLIPFDKKTEKLTIHHRPSRLSEEIPVEIKVEHVDWKSILPEKLVYDFSSEYLPYIEEDRYFPMKLSEVSLSGGIDAFLSAGYDNLQDSSVLHLIAQKSFEKSSGTLNLAFERCSKKASVEFIPAEKPARGSPQPVYYNDYYGYPSGYFPSSSSASSESDEKETIYVDDSGMVTTKEKGGKPLQIPSNPSTTYSYVPPDPAEKFEFSSSYGQCAPIKTYASRYTESQGIALYGDNSAFGGGRPGAAKAADLVTIPFGTTASTKNYRVHQKAAHAFECVREYIKNKCPPEAQNYKIGSSGTYVPRLKTGGSTLSDHSWGTAIDLNYGANPFKTFSEKQIAEGKYTNIPQCVITAFKTFGFAWGGDPDFFKKSNTRDAMHFEFRGLDPSTGGSVPLTASSQSKQASDQKTGATTQETAAGKDSSTSAKTPSGTGEKVVVGKFTFTVTGGSGSNCIFHAHGINCPEGGCNDKSVPGLTSTLSKYGRSVMISGQGCSRLSGGACTVTREILNAAAKQLGCSSTGLSGHSNGYQFIANDASGCKDDVYCWDCFYGYYDNFLANAKCAVEDKIKMVLTYTGGLPKTNSERLVKALGLTPPPRGQSVSKGSFTASYVAATHNNVVEKWTG